MYQINEFSKKSGFSKRMLRYLEEMKLLTPARTDSDYRQYSESDLRQSHKIQFLRSCGFSFEEIKTLLSDNLDKFIEKLTALRISKEQDIQAEYLRIDKIIKTTKELSALNPETSFIAINTISEMLPALEREKLLESYDFKARVIIGNFPEFEVFGQNLTKTQDSVFHHTKIETITFCKFGERAMSLPPGELIVYSLEPFYSHFTIYIPDEVRIEKEWGPNTFSNEAIIFKKVWEERFLTIQPTFLSNTKNLSTLHDLYNDHDVCLSFEFRITLEEKEHPLFLILPYHIIHAVKNIAAGNEVTKKISETIKNLSNDELIKRTTDIPNEEYLSTIALVDHEARGRLLSLISDKAREHVLEDLDKFKILYLKYWS